MPLNRIASRPRRLTHWLYIALAVAAMAVVAAPSALADSGCHIWSCDPWMPFGAHIPPPKVRSTTGSLTLSITSYIGERVPAAVMVSNLTDVPASYRIMVGDHLDRREPAPSAEDQLEIDRVVIREVVVVEARDNDNVRRMVPDALPRLNQAGVLLVPARQTRQLWIDVDTRGMSAGEYVARLHIMPITGIAGQGEPGAQTQQVELELHVLPLLMPDRPRNLSIAVWEYESWILGPHGAAIIEDIIGNGRADHLFLDVASGGLPWRGEIGNVASEQWQASEIDFRRMHRMVNRKKGDGRTLILLNTAASFHEGILNLDSEQGQRAYIRYLTACIDELRALGVRDEEILLQIKDEAGGEWSARNHRLARAFRETDPERKIKIFQTIGADTELADLHEMTRYVDVWCVWQPRLGRTEELELLKNSGKPVWNYNCSVNSKVLSPSGYYRATPLVSWRNGLQGCGIWSYDAGYGHVWNDFDSQNGDSAVVYPGLNGPVSSKRWQAWQRGIEDYMALELLADLIKQGEGNPRCAQACQAGRQLLTGGVATLLDPPPAVTDFDSSPEETKWRANIEALRRDVAQTSLELHRVLHDLL